MIDVAIAGAGPVGLWLAAELSLAGAEVLMLEKAAERSPHSKALTMHPRTVELFEMRGLAELFMQGGRPVPSSHYGLLPSRLDYRGLDTPHPYVLFHPQLLTEQILEDHVRAKGADIRREHAVTGVEQDGEGVSVTAETPDGPRSFRARWLVGCDGPGSGVRKACDIDFVGFDGTYACMLGDVKLKNPPEQPALTLNGDKGALYLVQLGPDRYRVATIDHARLHAPRDEPVTIQELEESILRCTGLDLRPYDPTWLSRFVNTTRQAERYRQGRVFLAGDAAHIHWPMGGQGLNLGIQDASNLAWKLAAALKGAADEALLDSYQSERHAVGEVVVDDTLAQTALAVARTVETRALRARLSELIGADPALNRTLADRVSGLDLAYAAPEGAHRLVGRRAPDLALEGAASPSLFGLMRDLRFLLLDLSGGAAPVEEGPFVKPVSARLAQQRSDWAGVQAALIRPDGYVAWASDTAEPAALAAEARAAAAPWRVGETV